MGVIIRYLRLARCPRWQHIRKQMFLSEDAKGGNGRCGSLCACLGKYVIKLKEVVGSNVVRSDGKMYSMEDLAVVQEGARQRLGKSRNSEERQPLCWRHGMASSKFSASESFKIPSRNLWRHKKRETQGLSRKFLTF